MDKLERLGCLFLTFLNHPGGLSFARIRTLMPLAYEEEGESARRKFERDKEELRNLGLDLRYYAVGEPLPDGRLAEEHLYIPEEELQRLPLVTLSPEESSLLASVLLTAMNTDAREGNRNLDALRSAAAKLLYRNPAPLLTAPADPPRFRSELPGEEDEEVWQALRLIHEALSRRRILRFDYTDSEGRTGNRRVESRGLISRTGRWCLVAGSPDTKGVRYYYLDRMSAMELEREGYANDPEFDIRRHSLHPLSLEMESPVNVRIRISDEKGELFSDFLTGAPDRLGIRRVNGDFTFTTSNPGALYSWMVRNPGSVEGLHPESLIDGFANYLEEMKRLHASS